MSLIQPSAILRRAIRGATISFTFQFKTLAGDPFTPPTAKLYVNYKNDGVATTDEITLTEDGGKFSGIWQSAQADAGTVYWDARSSGSTQVAVTEGSFDLSANNANPGD